MPQAKFLQHYATRLNGVEINYTFRHMPSASTLESWAKATPDGFAFAIKAHQRITHFLRLQGAEDVTAYFLKALDPLRAAGRLGPVLFQLPPNLKHDAGRLAAYLDLLPADVRVAFEFRDQSWLADDVFDLLREHNVSLCVAESEKLEVPEVITADFVYYRLRKPDYSAAEIEAMRPAAASCWPRAATSTSCSSTKRTTPGALRAEQLLRSAAAVAAAAPGVAGRSRRAGRRSGCGDRPCMARRRAAGARRSPSRRSTNRRRLEQPLELIAGSRRCCGSTEGRGACGEPAGMRASASELRRRVDLAGPDVDDAMQAHLDAAERQERARRLQPGERREAAARVLEQPVERAFGDHALLDARPRVERQTGSARRGARARRRAELPQWVCGAVRARRPQASRRARRNSSTSTPPAPRR